MWNLSNNMEDIRRRKGEMNWGDIRWGDEPREMMDSRKQTEGFREVGIGFNPVMGIKEGTYCNEHWLLYTNNESWEITSKTKVLYSD